MGRSAFLNFTLTVLVDGAPAGDDVLDSIAFWGTNGPTVLDVAAKALEMARIIARYEQELTKTEAERDRLRALVRWLDLTMQPGTIRRLIDNPLGVDSQGNAYRTPDHLADTLRAALTEGADSTEGAPDDGS